MPSTIQTPSPDPEVRFCSPRERINLADFGVGLFLFIFLPALAFGLIGPFFGKMPTTTIVSSSISDAADRVDQGSEVARQKSGASEHAAIQLIRQDKGVLTILLLFFLTCVLAPINEEFLFRGTFQQSLENVVRFQNQSWIPSGFTAWLTVIIPAVLFSSIHLRVGTTVSDIHQLAVQLICGAVGHVFFAPLFFGWLRLIHGIRLADVLGPLSSWRSQIQSGALAFVLLLVPVYLVQIAANWILRYYQCAICADPFALLILALGMSWLYYRYQTILASITLHLLFNGAGLLAAYWLI